MKKKRRHTRASCQSTKALIRKKKRAFHKKAKKNAKQMIALGIKPRRRHKKNQLAVPNLCPFKKDLIKKALRRRQDLKIELEQKKIEKKQRKSDIQNAIENCKKDQQKGLRVPKSLQNTSWGQSELKLPRSDWEHKHFYFKELNQVIANSDVIVEVLDARDPQGCRSKLIEKKIIRGKSNTFAGNKKLILLINKIDLIPSQILSDWMKILKREYPVIAFKASTQSKKRKLHSNVKYNKVTSDKSMKNINRCIGGQILIDLLKKYSIALDITTPITVGFIGYPNTGKSSVINSLKRQQSVGTSSTAGFTTKLKEVKLDKMIKLIDSPGVILNDNENETRLVLRNALKLQRIDPISCVAHILSVANHKSLAGIYDIDMGKKRSFKSYDEFLSALAFKINHLKSGGVPDLFRAARLMINDWNHGKIPFYVSPPQRIETNTEVKFVKGFDEEFDVNKFLEANHCNAVALGRNKKSKGIESYLKVDAEKFVVGDESEDEQLDDIEEDEEDDDDDMDMDNDNNNDLIDEEIMKTDAFITA